MLGVKRISIEDVDRVQQNIIRSYELDCNKLINCICRNNETFDCIETIFGPYRIVYRTCGGDCARKNEAAILDDEVHLWLVQFLPYYDPR